MGKFNPWALPRPARASRTATYRDPDHPGVEITITWRQLGVAHEHQAAERALQLEREYLPSEENPEPNRLPADFDGQLTGTLLRVVALMEVAQEVESEEERYSWWEFLGIADRMPAVFSAMQQDLTDLLTREKPDEGNPHGRSTAPSSDQPAGNIINLIPSLSTSGIASSDPSTTG